jgi:hypothetical protein
MLIYIHYWELMKLVWSHDSWSLSFMIKVMVQHFVSDTHNVMTKPILVILNLFFLELPEWLPSMCCGRFFPAIS